MKRLDKEIKEKRLIPESQTDFRANQQLIIWIETFCGEN